MNSFDKNSVFVVFSNDIQVCKKDPLFIRRSGVYFVDNNDELTDMYLMTKCKGHIISNSLYSWWGAYLSENRDNTVLPNKWLGKLKLEDVSVPGWKIIEELDP